jgi:hypothetical protein
MPGFDNNVVFADNVDFSGGSPVAGKVTTDGQLLIGSTNSPKIRVGTLTAGPGVSITNGAGSITIGLSGGGQAIDSLSTDLSGPVAPDSNGNVAVIGSSTLFSDGSTANTLKLNIQGTNHALFVGRGALTAATTLGAATNGQIPIGSTGADPVLATLTAGTGVSITNGAGSITIAASGGGMTWTEVTGVSQSAAVNNGYIANNAGLVTITLPSTFAVGDVVRIGGKGAGLWALAANTGDTIHFGAQDTSVGGSLTATNRYDTVEVVGITANSDWLVLSSVGNLTVA